MSPENGKRVGGRPTLEDVAARAGVSRALASIVMRGVAGASDGTRQRVLQAAAEIGYRPDARARLLASGNSRLLGVVFGMSGRFHLELLDGLYAAAEKAGYELILSALTPSRDERASRRDPPRLPVRGGNSGRARRRRPRARRSPARRRDRVAGGRPVRGRDPDLGHRGDAAGGRPSGRPRAPAHPACRRRGGPGLDRPSPRLSRRHAPATASSSTSGSSTGGSIRRTAPRPRGSCWTGDHCRAL